MPGAAAPQFRHADVVCLIVEAELTSHGFGSHNARGEHLSRGWIGSALSSPKMEWLLT